MEARPQVLACLEPFLARHLKACMPSLPVSVVCLPTAPIRAGVPTKCQALEGGLSHKSRTATSYSQATPDCSPTSPQHRFVLEPEKVTEDRLCECISHSSRTQITNSVLFPARPQAPASLPEGWRCAGLWLWVGWTTLHLLGNLAHPPSFSES